MRLTEGLKGERLDFFLLILEMKNSSGEVENSFVLKARMAPCERDDFCALNASHKREENSLRGAR